MKILPFKTEYNVCNYPMHNTKPIFGSSKCDTFVKNSENIFPLKEITSKTAQLLYGTNYKPVSEPIEGYYLSHALDKKTLKPVDIYIKEYAEGEYNLFRKNPDGSLKNVGSRIINFQNNCKNIFPGFMESLDKSIIGLGHLEHQLAIEKMLQLGYDNLMIEAIQSAYDFHTKAGFKSVDNFVYRPAHMLAKMARIWAVRLKTNEETIEKMFVFKPDGEVSLLNHNKTMENFIIFMEKNGIKISDEIRIDMELTRPALKEWMKLIKLKPIMLK